MSLPEGIWLVIWNMNFMTFHIFGMSSSQLTNSIIFQRGKYSTNQIVLSKGFQYSYSHPQIDGKVNHHEISSEPVTPPSWHQRHPPDSPWNIPTESIEYIRIIPFPLNTPIRQHNKKKQTLGCTNLLTNICSQFIITTLIAISFIISHKKIITLILTMWGSQTL